MTRIGPDQIMAIAKAKGYFSCSLRYRDDALRRICRSLVQQGSLKLKSKKACDATIFYFVVHGDGAAR